MTRTISCFEAAPSSEGWGKAEQDGKQMPPPLISKASHDRFPKLPLIQSFTLPNQHLLSTYYYVRTPSNRPWFGGVWTV